MYHRVTLANTPLAAGRVRPLQVLYTNNLAHLKLFEGHAERREAGLQGRRGCRLLQG